MPKKYKLPKNILNKMTNYPDFYQKVWLECSKIKPGKTMTYSQIASKIGNPKAYRAVGQALAKNPFAPLVPCHRVVGCNGKLGGYSCKGGIKKKLELLMREKQ